jgi:hypothetical protein
MNPAIVIGLIQAVIAAAPDIAKAAAAVKDFISGLVGAGVIDAAKQDALKAYVDSCMQLALTGQLPDHWRVEPDPQ